MKLQNASIAILTLLSVGYFGFSAEKTLATGLQDRADLFNLVNKLDKQRPITRKTIEKVTHAQFATVGPNHYVSKNHFGNPLIKSIHCQNEGDIDIEIKGNNRITLEDVKKQFGKNIKRGYGGSLLLTELATNDVSYKNSDGWITFCFDKTNMQELTCISMLDRHSKDSHYNEEKTK